MSSNSKPKLANSSPIKPWRFYGKKMSNFILGSKFFGILKMQAKLARVIWAFWS
jgi:hypothetical protein